MLSLNTIEKAMKQVCKDYMKGEKKMYKRYCLIQHNGKVGITINQNDNDPESLENAAQIFNEQNNGYNYFVIDKLNPPNKEQSK